MRERGCGLYDSEPMSGVGRVHVHTTAPKSCRSIHSTYIALILDFLFLCASYTALPAFICLPSYPMQLLRSRFVSPPRPLIISSEFPPG